MPHSGDGIDGFEEEPAPEPAPAGVTAEPSEVTVVSTLD